MEHPELRRQFNSRRDRMLARAAAYPILLIALGILVFSLWDHWHDPDGAAQALWLRVATALVLLPFYGIQRRRLASGLGARCLHSAVFLVGMAGSCLAVMQLRDGLLWGQAGILMFPLAFGFYPVSLRWYLGSALTGLLVALWLAMLAAVPSAQMINLTVMFVICTWVGATALSVLQRQQLRLFEMERLHAENARTDPLTGLLNRRSLEEAGRRQSLMAQRAQRPAALLMLDIDHFKQVNDRFGHDAGDEALVLVAASLARTLRSVDYLGRWGGEEFLAILPDTNAAQAGYAADRCLDAVRAIRFSRGGNRIGLRLSIGIAERRAEESFEAWTKRADLALYAAKEGGRDRAVIDRGG